MVEYFRLRIFSLFFWLFITFPVLLGTLPSCLWFVFCIRLSRINLLIFSVLFFCRVALVGAGGQYFRVFCVASGFKKSFGWCGHKLTLTLGALCKCDVYIFFVRLDCELESVWVIEPQVNGVNRVSLPPDLEKNIYTLHLNFFGFLKQSFFLFSKYMYKKLSQSLKLMFFS